MLLKFDMNLKDVNSLYTLWLFQRQYEIRMKLNFEHIKTCLNNMLPSVKFTFESPEFIYENGKKVRVLNFLDVKIILHEDNSVESDMYYKLPKIHDYLAYDSTHPDRTKNKIPYNLAKRVIVFVSNPEKVIIRLDELRINIQNM